jgi:hypothetical protein
MESYSEVIKMAIIKKTTNARKDAGKREPLYTVDGNVNSSASLEISMEVPQKMKNGSII